LFFALPKSGRPSRDYILCDLVYIIIICEHRYVFSTSKAVHVFLLPVGHLSTWDRNIFSPKKYFPINIIHHNSVTRHKKFNHRALFKIYTNIGTGGSGIFNFGVRSITLWAILIQCLSHISWRWLRKILLHISPSENSPQGRFYSLPLVVSCLCPSTIYGMRTPVHNLLNISWIIGSPIISSYYSVRHTFPLQLNISINTDPN